MQPLDLQLVLPQAHPAELVFLKLFLVLDPAKRLSATAALGEGYFTDFPIPSACSELFVPKRRNGTVKEKPLLVDSVESFMSNVVDKLF